MDVLLIALASVGGGLGLFLLGMRHLSDGLQAAGGNGLRGFMSVATGKSLSGVAMGAGATLLMQSSSIVTVMLVGFVESRMMTLVESINVLVGANIGTTFTIWLMAFAPSPEMLGLGALACGAAGYFFLPRGRLRHISLALIGLGLVFLGMHFMKAGVEPVKSSPALMRALATLDARTIGGVFAVAAVSCAFTAVIQSSAAGILIFMTLASEGMVPYETAIASLFGANIGTTATLWLATIGGGSAARRLALAHTLTNLAGSLVCIPFALCLFAPFGKWLFPDWEVRVMAPIAVTDTVFSLIRGVLVFPFARQIAKFLEWLVPERADEKPHLSALNSRGRISPVIACEQAATEVEFMAASVVDMLRHVRKALVREADEKSLRHVAKREEILDSVQSEVTAFLGEIMLKRLPSQTAALARDLLRLADELESLSDEAPAIQRALQRIYAEGEELEGETLATVLEVHDAAVEMATFGREELQGRVDLKSRREQSARLKEMVRNARQKQLLRIGAAKTSSAAVLATLDILNAYDRIRSYSMNIAEICAGGKKK